MSCPPSCPLNAPSIQPSGQPLIQPIAHHSARPRGLQIRRALVALLALGALARQGVADAADAFELVTRAESGREQLAALQAPPPPPLAVAPRTRSMAVPRSGPLIRVLMPSQTQAVPAPLRIEIEFEPSAGARIVPSSFRMLYGVLKIDLTERLRRHATVSEAGVVIERAQIPDGMHRLFLQVADDQGQQAEQELRLRVGTSS